MQKDSGCDRANAHPAPLCSSPARKLVARTALLGRSPIRLPCLRHMDEKQDQGDGDPPIS